jgi:4-aminobutyrate aminotransferase-like enzyme
MGATMKRTVMKASNRPQFSADQACQILEQLYGRRCNAAQALPSERDQNFKLCLEDGACFVLKIANRDEDPGALDAQDQMLDHLAGMNVPGRVRTIDGGATGIVRDETGASHFVRLLTYLPGTVLAKVEPHSDKLLSEVGAFMGRLDWRLANFDHPAARRRFHWDLQHAGHTIAEHIDYIQDRERHALVERFLETYHSHLCPALPMLRRSVIHHDGNDHNLLVSETGVGLIDFGDFVYSCTVFEAAVTAAYAMLGKPDPLAAAAQVIGGYHGANPLTELETELLYYLIGLRLATSVSMSAFQQRMEPETGYLSISEKAAWDMLEALANISPRTARSRFRAACGLPESAGQELGALQAKRKNHLGYNLSLSYDRPLKIIRGAGQYLYDQDGVAYLDMVNNVCHVGHSHPQVVQAGARQMAMLNTNTRYLHDNIVRLAERLAATLPPELSVCYFVCSGSEANDLALRMARAHTGSRQTIVLDVAYHGNLSSLIDISPYKHNGPGGRGTPAHVQVLPMPDGYRGLYQGFGAEVGRQYSSHADGAIAAIEGQGNRVGTFIAESLLGCGGQVVLPAAYLATVYDKVRAAGGVCIADEVQVGFGRVGTHFWGYETQGVVPDIVTVGKPFGNGHPLAAVVTTPEIAASFHNGMEYFNTFGGNPVSCAVGLAVLDVIEAEGLQDHARVMGDYLLREMAKLQEAHPLIGHVRGLGLFLGIELVSNRERKTPAASQAPAVVNLMKQRSVLLSTDGPDHNVIKIKPPMVFNRQNADYFLGMLDDVLKSLEDVPPNPVHVA